jgi:regulator of sigma E protease
MRPLLQSSTTGTVDLKVLRKTDTVSITSKLNAEKKLGIPPISDFDQLQKMGVLKNEHKSYGFLESIPAGVALTKDKLMGYIDQFKKMLQPKTGAYKGLGGFKAIANAFPSSWNWESFWNITGFLSIVLAFMNLLPIPALDGGHVMFTLYEMITRRKPNEKFLEYAQMGGMILLMLLMLYANGNDWFGWGK